MSNEELNQQLYEKLVDEQDKFRLELLALTPVEILRRAPEYYVREDIIHALRRQPITEAQAAALLCSDTPLDDVYYQLVGMAEQRHCLLHQAIEDLAERNLQQWNLAGRRKSGEGS